MRLPYSHGRGLSTTGEWVPPTVFGENMAGDRQECRKVSTSPARSSAAAFQASFAESLAVISECCQVQKDVVRKLSQWTNIVIKMVVRLEIYSMVISQWYPIVAINMVNHVSMKNVFLGVDKSKWS